MTYSANSKQSDQLASKDVIVIALECLWDSLNKGSMCTCYTRCMQRTFEIEKLEETKHVQRSSRT